MGAQSRASAIVRTPLPVLVGASRWEYLGALMLATRRVRFKDDKRLSGLLGTLAYKGLANRREALMLATRRVRFGGDKRLSGWLGTLACKCRTNLAPLTQKSPRGTG